MCVVCMCICILYSVYCVVYIHVVFVYREIKDQLDLLDQLDHKEGVELKVLVEKMVNLVHKDIL